MKSKIIVLTLCEWICVFVAAWCALQTEFDNVYCSIAMLFVVNAGLLEYAKNESKED